MWDQGAVGSGVLRVTLSEGMRAMAEVVAERGAGYVYPDEWRAEGSAGDGGCLYVVDGRPACLIGAALARLGVPVSVLRSEGDGEELDDCADGCEGPLPARPLLETLCADLPPLLADAYQAAQDAQDKGRTWGEAYAETLAALPAGAL